MTICDPDNATWTAKPLDTIAYVHEQDGLVCVELPWGEPKWLMVDWLTALRIAWSVVKYAGVAAWHNQGSRKPPENFPTPKA